MKLKPLMDRINPKNFLESYAKAKGVENINAFFNPQLENMENPAHYDNITKGAELIEKHVLKRSKIAIVMHVDCDSLFSNAIIYSYLKGLDKELEIDVIFPEIKSQGFNENVMRHLRDNPPDLIWIGDAGTSDYEQIKELNEVGIDIIVTDHHEQSLKARDKDIQNYCVLINNQMSKDVENKYLSGCGVTWKLMQHVDYMNGINDSDKYIDIVAVSLLADVMNTTSQENRTIMKYGLNNVQNPLLKLVFEKLGKSKTNNIVPDDYGWNVNPLINGSVKMGYFRELFYGLVEPYEQTTWKQGTTRITNKKGTNLDRALYVIRNKGKEKKLVVEEAFNHLNSSGKDDKIIMTFDDGTTPKFLGGDVAGKFNSVYNKPSLMFMDSGKDYYTGSCRSNIPLKEIIQDSGLFEYAEGHDSAFGYKILKENVPQLKKYVDSLDLSIEPEYEVICIYDHKTIDEDLFYLVDSEMDLFAKGFEVPNFGFKLSVKGDSIFFMSGGHFKFSIDGIEYIKFNPNVDLYTRLSNSKNKTLEVTIVGKLSLNEYMGMITPQVIIKDMEIEDEVPLVKKVLNWDDIF